MNTSTRLRPLAGPTAALLLGLFAAPALTAAPAAPAPTAAAVRTDAPAFQRTDVLPDLAPALMDSWGISPETLKPALDRLAKKKEARVLYIGGSITQNPGWQNFVSAALAAKYPQIRFTFDNIGIGSQATVSHAFRWRSQAQNPHVDLVFFEGFNDMISSDDQLRKGFEGTIRGLRTTNPDAGLVILHLAEPGNVKQYRQGRVARTIRMQTEIARHYGLPQIFLAKEVADRISAGQFSWQKDFKNLHPAPFGQRLYANGILHFLGRVLAVSEGRELTLPAPLTPTCYTDGTLLPANSAYSLNRTQYVENWKATQQFRRRFTNCPALVSQGIGASFSVDFDGRLFGLFTIAVKRSAQIEWSVDGSEWKTAQTYTHWSHYIDMPSPLVLTETLPEGHHTAKIRIKQGKKDRDTLVIYGFMVLGGKK